MSAPERNAWDADQAARLEAFAAKRGTTATEMRKIADTVLEFAPKPLTDAMRASGGLDDAQVIMLLAHQGQRMAHRRTLRG